MSTQTEILGLVVVSHITSGQTHSSNSSSNTLLVSAAAGTTYWTPAGASGVAYNSVLAPVAGVAAFFATIFAFPTSIDKDPIEMSTTVDYFLKNPDDWTPPPGVSETIAGEKTGGKNRQWKDEYGNVVRRWDKGEPGKPGFGGKDHWHDLRHILP